MLRNEQAQCDAKPWGIVNERTSNNSNARKQHTYNNNADYDDSCWSRALSLEKELSQSAELEVELPQCQTAYNHYTNKIQKS